MTGVKMVAAAVTLSVIVAADIEAEIHSATLRVAALQAKMASLEARVRRGATGGTDSKVYPPIRDTDHHFFAKDYPADGRPDIRTHFGHPYPAVQDSDDYDNDFVKDENSDNGLYDAQMAYDKLRTLKRKEEGAVGDMVKKAKQEADAARASSGGGASGKGGSGDAAGDLSDAQKDLGNCKLDLEKALAKLADLMDEKSEIQRKKAAAEAALVPLRKKRDAIHEQVDSLSKALEVHEHRYTEFEQELTTAKTNYRKGKEDLTKALAVMRRFRQKNLDDNADLYDGHTRSQAKTQTGPWTILAALLLGVLVLRG